MNACFASWYITEKCNFRCTYCAILNPHGVRKLLRDAKKKLKKQRGPSINPRLTRELDAVLERFLRTGKTFTFGFTGGEPLRYPGFLDICRRIVAHDEFKIALDTNLCIGDIRRFTDTVPPHKVEYIYTSLHIAERERLYGDIDAYLTDVVHLNRSGYEVTINYVMYPDLFERVERDHAYCLDRGVRLQLKSFRGAYAGKVYPAAYTDAEKALIDEYNGNEFGEWPWSRDFYGRPCNAGKTLIRIAGNGDVTRCAGDDTLLGNIFTGFELYEEPQPCRLKSCPCFSPEVLFDGIENEPAVPVRDTPLDRMRRVRTKLRAFWEQA